MTLLERANEFARANNVDYIHRDDMKLDLAPFLEAFALTERQPLEKVIADALNIASAYGTIDGDHHKAWAIDQMVRAMTNCPLLRTEGKDGRGQSFIYYRYGESQEYQAWVAAHKAGSDGPDTYGWNEGIAP